MTGFSNPVTNAGGDLIRNVLHSFGFVTGVSGWQISRNGDAEFNAGTFRGSVLIGPIGGAHILLDASTGIISVVGSSGGQIQIDPTTAFPMLHFFSDDGTNDAFINAVSTGSDVDLGFNSGIYTPGDGVPRRGRLFLHDSTDVVELAVIEQSTQAKKGGFVQLRSGNGFFGYFDSGAVGAPNVFMRVDSAGAFFNAPTVAASQDISAANNVTATHDVKGGGNVVLTSSTGTFQRVADIVNPLHFQADQQCSAGTTVTATVDAVLAGTTASFVTSIAVCKYSVQLVADIGINNAGTTAIAVLNVDGANVLGEAHLSAAVGGRATVSQTYEGTVAGSGIHTWKMNVRMAGAGQSATYNATHSKLGIRLYE